jgi:hypothetical protein
MIAVAARLSLVGAVTIAALTLASPRAWAQG